MEHCKEFQSAHALHHIINDIHGYWNFFQFLLLIPNSKQTRCS